MTYIVRGLPAASFTHLFGLPDDELAQHRTKRVVADAPNSYPDRIGLRDAEPGEVLLLLNYTHQSTTSPYHASHAIYVREGASETGEAFDKVPEVMTRRLLSLRGFDQNDMIVSAKVVPGAEADPVIREMLRDPDIRYIHAHNAAEGCYHGLIERSG
ncbi:DUF1203 domain-containing protein [Gymnodinialimonas sp. 2305UL16-5]|uniref:DUF1203 domain-containing protein n=1 Tax=Gymnodinialimonas mytili TaxID=3126503 RepID=UPI0030976CA8